MTEQDNAAAKVRELIKDTRIAMLTHVNGQGKLVSKPMGTQDVEFDGTIYFIAQRDSDQAQELQRNSAVNVAYSGPGSWVSVTGTARVLNDEAKLRELWDSFTGAWLEGGPENPNNILIEIDADTAEYWDAPGNSKVTQVANLIKSKVKGDTVDGENKVVDL